MKRSELRKLIREVIKEKKLGFSRADYDDEAIDALKDFSQAGELLNQQIKEN